MPQTGDAWLDGFERVPNARSEGGSYVADVPWRFVAHTTEVIPGSLDGARALASRHQYPPHLWVWPEREWRCQTVRLDRSAFALLHPAGTPETNKMGALQVEIIGYASVTSAWPAAWWEWLGEKVLHPIIEAGYPIDLANVAPTTGCDGYGNDGAVRMSRSAWRNFDGVCCHANVPDNHHWDIGRGRLDLIAAAAASDTPPVPTEEDDMPFIMKPLPGHSFKTRFFDPPVATHIGTATEKAHVAKGVKVLAFTNDEAERLLKQIDQALD